jgi:putative nucleotidyltransferase with HDIG domain
MRRSILAVSRRTQRTLKAIPVPGLALFLALVLIAVVNTAMPMPAFAVGTVVPLDPWPAIPQMTGTTGNPANVTFAVSAGTNRLLVVLVCDYDNGGATGQTFTATYGGKTLTQAVLQNDNRRQTWIGYLKETDITSRSGNTVTVTVTGIHTNVVAYIASYSGVDQTTPVTAANGVYINNANNQPIGGPLTVNTGGYGIYGWSGASGTTRTSDTETYTEHSDVNNPGTFNYGVASKAFATTGSTNPSVTWSGNNRVSVSFITLNPGSYPVPTTTGISPTTKTEGDAGFTLTVDGTNFVSGASVVRLDEADRTTTFVSSTQLTATIPASDLTTAGAKSITVFNPTPGGGISNAQTLTVDEATLTVNKTATAATVSSSAGTSTHGDEVTFTAIVTGAGATGTVTFKDGGTTLGSSTLSNGTASYTTSTLPVGSHFITAVYDGDANFAGSTSSAVELTVKTAAGLGWSMIAGMFVAAVVVGLFFLLVDFVRMLSKVKEKDDLSLTTNGVLLKDQAAGLKDAGKTHGDADPVLTYHISSGSLATGDAFNGAIARVVGEDVGIYAIQLERELERSVKKLENTMEAAIQAISYTMETRDPYTAGHQKRVAQLACAIAKEMGVAAPRIDGIRVAGLLHDIGKIAVPAEILSKPGKLSDVEFSMIKAHPKVAFDILKNVEFEWPIARVVVQHHERLDGSGYPYGIGGKDILQEAMILAVADVVEAMSSHRPYRAALGIEEALAEVARGEGTLYDSEVVRACAKVINKRGFKFESMSSFLA